MARARGPLSLHPAVMPPACDGEGGASGGCRARARPPRQRAPVARSPRVGALCHDPTRGGKKAQGQRPRVLLAWARAACAGAGAADAREAGPAGVRSAVDKRPDKRLRNAGLDHQPPPDAIAALLGRVQTALADRAWALKGLTTAGAARAPAPRRTVGGERPPQRGPCPGSAAWTTGVVSAVASARARQRRHRKRQKRVDRVRSKVA